MTSHKYYIRPALPLHPRRIGYYNKNSRQDQINMNYTLNPKMQTGLLRIFVDVPSRVHLRRPARRRIFQRLGDPGVVRSENYKAGRVLEPIMNMGYK